MVFDELRLEAGENRFGELINQFWAELNDIVDTIVANPDIRYTRDEYMLLLTNAITSGLLERARTEVEQRHILGLLKNGGERGDGWKRDENRAHSSTSDTPEVSER